MTLPRLERPDFGSAEFSTDAVRATDRFEYWRTQFGQVHDVDVAADQRCAFEGRASIWRLGPIVVGEFATSARRIARTQRQVRQDDLDHIVLRVVPAGPKQCQSGHPAEPYELGIGTYATAYDQDLPEGPWVTAILDRDAFPELWGWQEAPQMVRGTFAALLAYFLVALPHALRTMEPEEVPKVAQALHTTISACLAGCIGQGQAAVDDRAMLRLRIEQIIAANLSSPRLTPARLAELAGVSRSTLYRAFETEGGIAQSLLQRRLLLVRHDLETPALNGQSVAQIAERRGLHNAASFHRAFRQHVHQTPADYRAASQARLRAGSPGSLPGSNAKARQFIHMLRPLSS